MTAERGLLLVTGGAGFIGSAIVDEALKAGWRVRVLDSLRPDVHAVAPSESGEFGASDPRVDFRHADVTDAAAVADALQGVTVVSHQAAKVGLGVDFFDAPDYVRTNELGTAILLAEMTRAGIRRLVLASSMVVYGEGKYRRASGAESVAAANVAANEARFTTVRPGARRIADLEAGRFDPVDPDTGAPLEPDFIVEDDPLDPRNVYASSKLAQEHLAASWARSTGGRVVALRYHNVYGPGMPQNTPYAGVASLFRSALERGEAPRVFEDGMQRRDFVHVRDVASANLAAIDFTAGGAANAADASDDSDDSGAAAADTAGRAIANTAAADTAAADSASAPPASPPFRAFNVGSGVVHTIGDLAAALSRFSNGPEPVITGEFRLGDVRHITASSMRLQTELGWHPSVPFDEGVREFATAPLRAAVATGTLPASAASPRTDTPLPLVDVIFPCLNEAAALPWVLGRLPAGYRGIVVDNGSTDDSAAVARAHGALVVTEPRRGFGSAAHAGLLAATAPIVAFCDADASMDPAELPRLVELLGGAPGERAREGGPAAGTSSAGTSSTGAPGAGAPSAGTADLVLGRRRPTTRASWPLHARLANRALSTLIRVRAHIHLHDLGPLRAGRREQLLSLGLQDRRSGYPLEMVLRASAAGWRIVEVTTSYSPRVGRSKVTGTLRGTIVAINDMSKQLAAVKRER